jgi:predicted metal-dependent hydrolase
MKPSEYFYSMDNGKMYIPTKQIVLDMDKRFIDREDLEKEGYIKVNDTYGYSERLEKDAIHKYKEELKNKINKVYNKYSKNLKKEYYDLEIKKEILELLK